MNNNNICQSQDISRIFKSNSDYISEININ